MNLIAPLSLPLWLVFLLLVVICYFIGGISFAYVVGKLFYHIDLRYEGSGNLGTTNALRCLGVPAGVVVLILDGLKGVAAIYLARFFVPQNCTPQYYAGLSPLMRLVFHPGGYSASVAQWALLTCALAAILGHAFSPYLHFRGGKAMATTAGIIIAMEIKAVLVLLPLFLIVLLLTHYVSVASITTAVGYPLTTLIFYPSLPFIILSVAAALFVIWLHRSNIARLRNGTENKFSFRRARPSSNGSGG